jgi:class 3 adenylate cyclase
VHFVVIEAFLFGSCVIGTFASYFLESGARRNFLQQLLIEQERLRSEALLLNVLPAPIADRLKGGEEVVDAFDEVTVLFADIVDFTPFSATLTPHELVTFLNEVFSRFDALVERDDLEKIKTMGDAYMVVGGIPSPRSDHAERIADLALEMQEEAGRMAEGIGAGIQLRIGLNTGPVVAGVIGTRKFSYDLWGDTVNTASRMQAIAAPGKIEVTQRLYERLNEAYRFEGPTAVLVKGKGEMLTYRLTGRRPGSAVEELRLGAGALQPGG